MTKHRWSEPVRPDINNTLRTCSKCGLIKVTRHEPDNRPPHWIEFEMEGHKVPGQVTPVCEAGA